MRHPSLLHFASSLADQSLLIAAGDHWRFEKREREREPARHYPRSQGQRTANSILKPLEQRDPLRWLSISLPTKQANRWKKVDELNEKEVILSGLA